MARPLHITDETILESLADHPEATSADLADLLEIGQSTAGKRLAALEADGSVRRTPGGRENGRRMPDRWSPVISATTVATWPTTPETDADTGAPGTDEIRAAADVEAGGADAGIAETEDVRAADAEADTFDATAGSGSGHRLGRGELGSQVREFLAARPDESFGPAAVGKALGRSQGAISNSLATMAAKGEVVLVGDKPRRYRIAAS